MAMNEAYQMMMEDMMHWAEEGVYDDDEDIVSLLSEGESDMLPADESETPTVNLEDIDIKEVF